MSDSYQAIYDAVRSRISGGNIADAVSDAIRNVDIGFHVRMAQDAIEIAAAQYERPSTLYRPSIYLDGDHWCALYGDDLQNGIAGFGDSPSAAMLNFDDNFNKSIAKSEEEST